MKSNNGRISVKNRQAIVTAVAAFAASNNLAPNLVMSAVLWAAERNPSRMCHSLLTRSINLETVAAYQVELGRRNAAREAQITGMIKRALPKAARTPANIATIRAALQKAQAAVRKLSVTELKEFIAAEASVISA